MILSVIILDSVTGVAIKRVSIDSDQPETLNLLPNEQLSPRHDGDIGWRLTNANEWIDPNPPVRWTREQGIRNRRDYYLKKSDRYMTPDFAITESQRDQWRAYRQALRDMTAQPGFPDQAVWPVRPE